MLTAITRPVSATINRCELGYLERREIDFEKAAAQQAGYEAALAALGLRVVPLEPEPDLPDAVFVEDAAVVAGEVAVMTRMGASSRRPEAESVARALARYRPVHWLREPATLDGGDVMHAESAFFVGVSRRTNRAGIGQLSASLEPFGYSVTPVEVRDCLHMKSACCYLGRGIILANRAWIDPAPLRDFRILDVPEEEPWAANVLTIGESAILPSCFPATRRILERAGWNVVPVDVSEIMKAEGGVTCMSLIFDAA
jgi:dimethylargininase